MDNAAPVPAAPVRLRLGSGAPAWVQGSAGKGPLLGGSGRGGPLVGGSGSPVLLLHGWGLRPDVFRLALGHLARREAWVAAPSLAVLGRTWSLEAAVDRAVETVDHLEWPRAVVVGYSLGGTVAAALAAAHPERVRFLVLVNSVALPIDRGVAGWALPFARYARAGNLKAVRAFGRNALQLRGLQNLADAARYARAATLGAELDRIREQQTPAAVLWGADDRLLPIEMGRDVADRLDAPLHVVPNADHDWPILDPAMFAREVDLLIRSRLDASS
jgi:pimeloyl-ACP methyl ester carboxylesterase